MVSHTDSNFLPPIQTQEFLPSISPWMKLSGVFFVGAMALAVPLASVAKYKVTVKAPASLRPVGELRLVQAATEGQVMQIYVEHNQQIKKGDVIATIDDSRLQTKKSQLQSNIQQGQLQLVQINAQISALNSQMLAETDRSKRAVASAQAELERRRREYQDLTITTAADVEEAQANVRIAQEELHRGQVERKSTRSELSAAVASLKAAHSKHQRYQSISTEGALSQNQLEEAQLAAEQQEQLVEGQKARVEMQQKMIERLKEAVIAAQARLDRAKAMLNPSQAEITIASERLEQEKSSGQVTLATLNREREALIQQRIQIQKQLAHDSRELQQVEIDLSQTAITATTDGLIAQLNLRNSGQTVRMGEEIAQIVPSDAPLEIKAAVSPQEISKLKVGQKVQMRVTACPYPDYGTLTGAVSQISEDTTKPQNLGMPGSTPTTSTQKRGTSTAFYDVTIEPERLVLERGQHQCSLQTGMEGRADIVTREESVLRFLLRKARLIADL